jgi:hypothetical protein
MNELKPILTIAGGIVVAIALIPLAPVILIYVGSQVLGRSLQARFHVPVAKRLDELPPDDEVIRTLHEANEEFLRNHAPGPASKYYRQVTD